MSKIEDTQNTPVRVCQIVGNWVGGGVESVIMNYYRGIDRSKIQFDFVCSDISTCIPYGEIEKLGGRVFLVSHHKHIVSYSRALGKIFDDNHYQIVHSHINTLSVFPLRVAKKKNIPIRIAHSHSTTNKKEVFRNIVKNLLRPFSKVYATHFFACSKYAGEWLFGNCGSRVIILNNAIDFSKFKFNYENRKKRRDSLVDKEKTIIIGHVGRFVKQKNHDFLIDIYKQIHDRYNNTKLVLVGEGELKNTIERKVGSMGLSDDVEFLGQCDRMSDLYSAFDVFLMPSLYEGLPMTGVEAQASGLPCIFSTEITQELKITDSVDFVALEGDRWLEAFEKRVAKRENREVDRELFRGAGFDLEHEAGKLEKEYEQMLTSVDERE